MTLCPCCSNSLVRRIEGHQIYWFCRTCWQEMPILEKLNLCLLSPSLEREQMATELNRLPVNRLHKLLVPA